MGRTVPDPCAGPAYGTVENDKRQQGSKPCPDNQFQAGPYRPVAAAITAQIMCSEVAQPLPEGRSARWGWRNRCFPGGQIIAVDDCGHHQPDHRQERIEEQILRLYPEARLLELHGHKIFGSVSAHRKPCSTDIETVEQGPGPNPADEIILPLVERKQTYEYPACVGGDNQQPQPR